ncbi:MAG: ATP-dependent RNA helicase HrpA [Phycisphaeraceae bacterium]|nr:MAG: ATP-dependent RNA helicase HrpA [Phycisphaeraceae bacterium]
MTSRTPHIDLGGCLIADRARLARRLRGLDRSQRSAPDQRERVLAQIAAEARASREKRQAREKSRPAVEYPDLPVSAMRAEIAATIREHQVVVLCGETGSGKTTQLPKICLDAALGLGRGVDGMIGHTQPRRLAARTVAARIAEELGVSVGDLVGTKIRFSDRTGERTMVKLMTDGILLAETQSDRLFHRYDTLIIDEAHERSLNIDFLLGYLRQILPRRPDLKLIITSATIDPQRFAEHFETTRGPAPIIEVPGRTWPVEVHYRPMREQVEASSFRRDADDVVGAVLDCVREIDSQPRGDVLVFMPGEREIRETANALRRHFGDHDEILPLYARLSVEEQRKAFRPHTGRRIVIATNVAETSVTVPGIRYVIDPGTARISRYSARTKVQGLDVEAISRASADQRKGRCGRVGPGVCYRLFAEDDYDTREQFTPPEILRTNLASVVLQMAALRLGRPDEFPFVEPPDSRLIRDGYETLRELGAIHDDNTLTDIGRDLARLPIDPRIGRMVLAGHAEGCLHDVLIIAAGLAVQDPRDRPAERQDEADAAHERFRHEHSDFLGLLNIWHFYHDSIRPLSRSKRSKACRQNFLSERRLVEWGEVLGQLRMLVRELGLNQDAARPGKGPDEDAIHRALLTGLLTTIGKLDEKHEYQGTRGTRFYLHPSSTIFGDKPSWVMAGELVRTTRLYARTVAKIDPTWVEHLGEHLIKRTYSEPHWDAKSARVMAFEKVTLAGLEIIPKRRAHFGPVEPAKARELFIHHALVEGEFESNAPALRHNRELEASIANLEDKARRRDLLAEAEARFAFYDRRLPADVYSGQTFERWRRKAERENRRLLYMSIGDILIGEAGEVGEVQYPDRLATAGGDLDVRYRYDPGATDDGVTLDVPVEQLGQIDADRADRLVPGLLAEKVEALMRTLPKSVRRYFDISSAAREIAVTGLPQTGSLLQALAGELSRRSGIPIRPEQFQPEALPSHLSMRFRVLNDKGEELRSGRDLGELRRELADQVARGFRRLTKGDWNRDGLADWDFGDVPGSIEIAADPAPITGYPAIVDQGGPIGLRVFDTPEAAADAMRLGLARLYTHRLKKDLRFDARDVPAFQPIALAYATLGDAKQLRDELMLLIADRLFIGEKKHPRTFKAFTDRLDDAWNALSPAAHECVSLAEQVFTRRSAVASKLEASHPAPWARAVRDMNAQLASLVTARSLTGTPFRWLRCLPRFLRGIEVRLERLRTGVDRDTRAMAEVHEWQRRLAERAEKHAREGIVDPALVEFRWLHEELRVSLFAQELRTSVPVSPKRLEKAWERVRP